MNFNNKSEILKRANFLLKDGIKNRDSLFHTPIISSLSGNEISSRVMVLRDHIASKRVIRFHSDFRSDKVQELKVNKKISVIGYDPNLKTQIRLTGKAKINHKNKSVASRAYFNLALASEANGQIDIAITWINKSLDLGNKKAKIYKSKLEQRKIDEIKLEKQIN